MRRASRWLTLSLLGAAVAAAAAGDDGERKREDRWLRVAEAKLSAYGHRNWVAVVDSAYPLQVSPGAELLVTGGDHLEVLQAALDLIEKSKHVRPKVYLDAELPFVPERDARGITRLRNDLRRVLGRRPVQSVPHAKLLGLVEATAARFNVLILKTNCVLPYTSVFLELDCGYWSDEAEKRLREAMKEAAKKEKE